MAISIDEILAGRQKKTENSYQKALEKLNKKYTKRGYSPTSSSQQEEDPFSNYDKYQGRIQQEAANYRNQAEEARARGRAEATELVNNPPRGLTNQQRSDMRNQRESQIERDLQNYNRMLTGKQSVKGVRGGVTAAAQRDLQNMAQEQLSDYERGLAELDSNLALKKLAAIYGAGESEAAQDALLNQSAYDKIIGYLQNENQRKWANRADKYFSQI